jgi:prepilin-type N-terminal cleavage/methylation domain-containing protein
MNRRGFTLVELLVALVLVGIVAASIYQLLLNNQRIYTEQTERVDLNATIRAAVAMIPAELKEADATDALGSDIVAMTSSSITFKAMRALYVLCQAPSTGTTTSGDVIAYRSMAFGMRAVDNATDSAFVYAEGNPSIRGDNTWLHASVSGVSYGAACPSSAASVTFALTGIEPSGGLDNVSAAAPLRAYQVIQILTYTDALGDLWLGRREYRKGGGWSDTQPLLGPLAASGLQFTYYDSSGNTTNTPANVARIEIRVIGQTSRTVRASDGTIRYVVDTLTTQVALRNNSRD